MVAYTGFAGVVMGTRNIANGEPAVLALDGMWEIDCATGTTATAGAQAYFDIVTNLILTAAGSNGVKCGIFAKAKTSGQLKATIDLNVVPIAP
jgi:uncharacterized metal-binding protein